MKGKKGLRILLAEDHEAMRFVVQRMLRDLGHHDITIAEDGGKAFGIFKQNRGGFDLVVTDQNMLGMTGTHLVRGIRSLGSNVPIILMTGEPDEVQITESRCILVAKMELDEALAREIEKFFP